MPPPPPIIKVSHAIVQNLDNIKEKYKKKKKKSRKISSNPTIKRHLLLLMLGFAWLHGLLVSVSWGFVRV